MLLISLRVGSEPDPGAGARSTPQTPHTAASPQKKKMAWLHGAPLLEYTLAHDRTAAGKMHTHVASLLWPFAWICNASMTRRRRGWVAISVAEGREVDKIYADETGMRGLALGIRGSLSVDR